MQWPAGIGAGPTPLPDPVPLPGGPLLDRVFFESGWLLAGVLVVLAVVAVCVLNGRGSLKRGLLAGGGLLVLAAASWLVSTLVTTPREAVRSQTRAVVDGVGRADAAVLDSLLTDDIEIRYPGFESPSRAGLMATIARQMGPGGQFQLSSWRISELQATLDGPALARSQVLVRATHASTRIPASAWVMLKWERGSDGLWRCFAVEPIDVR